MIWEALAGFVLVWAVIGIVHIRKWLMADGRRRIAFFHPYYETCGGGERVLWCALIAIREEIKKRGDSSIPRLIVYVGADTEDLEEVVQAAEDRFGLELRPLLSEGWLEVCRVPFRWLLEPSTYPAFTMVGQSLGAFVVGCLSIMACPPDVFIDTTGWAPTFIPARLAGAVVGAYVHYPTISTDMLARVASRDPTMNSMAASSSLKTYIKLLYYRLFALIYGAIGRLAQKNAVLVNSSWTKAHIDSIWFGLATTTTKKYSYILRELATTSKEYSSILRELATTTTKKYSYILRELATTTKKYSYILRELATTTTTTKKYNIFATTKKDTSTKKDISSEKYTYLSVQGEDRAKLVYPPCNTLALSELEVSVSGRLSWGEDGGSVSAVIVSLGQFRPEKNHSLQLRALSGLLKRGGLVWKGKRVTPKLVMVGGSRHREDEVRVEELVEEAKSLGLRVMRANGAELDSTGPKPPKAFFHHDVILHTNASLSGLRAWLAHAVCGLHTMTQEHFGIGVVEFMAAGAVPVAHGSGGPLLDIVVDSGKGRPGLTAVSDEEYTQAMHQVIQAATNGDGKKWTDMVQAGRHAATTFSDDAFYNRFNQSLKQFY